MRNLIPSALIIVLAGMLISGCAFIAPGSASVNQPPVAYIDSISPTKVLVGETITFKGHGTDADGTVVTYRWRSSIDGELSVAASFDALSLSEGTHAVYFKVQDNNGAWSQEIYRHVTMLSHEITHPVINTFEASPESVTSGESITLNWEISGATSVSIDQEIGNVASAGTRIITPGNTTTYTLVATNNTGSVTATVEVVVNPSPVHTVELFSIAAEDGYVAKNRSMGPDPKVGDTSSSVAMQAFLSFDISMIPRGVNIKSASLDLHAATVVGHPFGLLGKMNVFHHQFGDLNSGDFIFSPAPGIIYSAPIQPLKPFSSGLLLAGIQDQVDSGSPRFQVRIQFDKYYFYNNEADYLNFGSGKPKLVIEYED